LAPVVTVVEYAFGPVMVKTAPASGAWVSRSSLVTRIAPSAFDVGVGVGVSVGGTGVLVCVGVTVGVSVGGTGVLVCVGVTVGVSVGGTGVLVGVSV
jgi:hypothetical protein